MDSGGIDLAAAHVEALEGRGTRAHAPATQERSPVDRVQALASGVGNRAFSQIVARMGDGEGILDSGLVHPDVEYAIAAARGGGRSLDGTLSRSLEHDMGSALNDVRVHTDATANALARAVSARAFTVGSDIFFASGEYQPGTADGNRLVAHEVAHVLQQRGAPSTGPLSVSSPGDALEVEAEALARDVAG